MYDIAKDYYIYVDCLDISFKDRWHLALLYWHLKNSFNIKTRYPLEFCHFRVRCGKRKLNKIIREIIFLGFDEEVWIQEANK